MSSRDDIMAAIRAHLPKLERPEPSIPLFDDDAPKNLLAAFGEQLERMGGELLAPNAVDPLAPVRDKISGASVSTVMRWLRLVGAPWKRGATAPIRPAAAARRSAGSGNHVLLSVAVVWVRS